MRSPGLFDLQVNGFAGVDFNDAGLTARRLDAALEAMLQTGVTGCLPTLITAHPQQLRERLAALDAAVRDSRLGPAMVPGYHIEGPFLNDGEGYRGCHPATAMTDPQPDLIAEIGRGLYRPVLLITLAPERAGGITAVRRFREMGMVVAAGHSAADFATIRAAADAGMSMSTHLGNGLPQRMHKLDNTLLAQLAEPRLTACLIADGHHISPGALRALIDLKGRENCVLVSDAVVAAAAPVGSYDFGGMQVHHLADGRVVDAARSGLAGSALRLDQAVRNVVDWKIAAPAQAFAMAGDQARAAIAGALRHHQIVLEPGLACWSGALEPKIERKPAITAGTSHNSTRRIS